MEKRFAGHTVSVGGRWAVSDGLAVLPRLFVSARGRGRGCRKTGCFVFVFCFQTACLSGRGRVRRFGGTPYVCFKGRLNLWCVLCCLFSDGLLSGRGRVCRFGGTPYVCFKGRLNLWCVPCCLFSDGLLSGRGRVRRFGGTPCVCFGGGCQPTSCFKTSALAFS
ncbi:hypothetical protein [Kingella potus]|uniref:hypothetical protein n=1 Tax=Kingella potus TaxID=265175 RepID=UPI001FD0ED21|nr:hypothetical protein [Kingella potus]UOP00201.1 hypothetical protein LVJ84_09720 [Kingella potus]